MDVVDRMAAIVDAGWKAGTHHGLRLLFRLLARVRPLMGRYLEEEDEREGAPAVVVIGENVWRNRFAGDPAILGRTIQLGATPHSIIGVMPKGFAFPINDHFWIPLRTGLAPEPRTGPDLMVFGRLAPGATLASAQAELAAIGQRTALAFPRIYAQLRPQVLPYARGTDDATGLLATQGLLVSLLVLVCLNVAILVYTRTAMRQAEIGMLRGVTDAAADVSECTCPELCERDHANE